MINMYAYQSMEYLNNNINILKSIYRRNKHNLMNFSFHLFYLHAHVRMLI